MYYRLPRGAANSAAYWGLWVVQESWRQAGSYSFCVPMLLPSDAPLTWRMPRSLLYVCCATTLPPHWLSSCGVLSTHVCKEDEVWFPTPTVLLLAHALFCLYRPKQHHECAGLLSN